MDPEVAAAALRASIEFSSEALKITTNLSPQLIRRTAIIPAMRERIAAMTAFVDGLEKACRAIG